MEEDGEAAVVRRSLTFQNKAIKQRIFVLMSSSDKDFILTLPSELVKLIFQDEIAALYRYDSVPPPKLFALFPSSHRKSVA